MERIELSQYAENLSVEAKDHYKSKLSDCQVDPYIDGGFWTFDNPSREQ